MAILIGLILMALGISLAAGQWESFVMVLRSLVALICLLWGFIAVLVGYSEMKARREYAQAVAPDEKLSPQASVSSAPTSDTAKPSPVARDTPPVSPAQ